MRATSEPPRVEAKSRKQLNTGKSCRHLKKQDSLPSGVASATSSGFRGLRVRLKIECSGDQGFGSGFRSFGDLGL